MRYLKFSFVVLCLLVGVGFPNGSNAQPAAIQVRISFRVASRCYEAVSFLRTGERWIPGDEMIARTDAENGGGLGKEDGELLWEHRSELPRELAPFVLVFTKWRDPVYPHDVRYFDWCGAPWCQRWGHLFFEWNGRALVIRRCT